MNRNYVCPHCFTGTVSSGRCTECGEQIDLKDGIPSTTETVVEDKHEKKLQLLSSADVENLDEILSAIRDSPVDGSIVDRFFQTRTVNWRMLVSSHLKGRGLVIGDHNEKVGILLGEVLEEVYTVDTSTARLGAQQTVANLNETKVNPVHADLTSLPFPTDSFDVIVVQCRSREIDTYLSKISDFLSDGGVILLLVDGWPREIGLTELIGLGDSPSGIYDRIGSFRYGHSLGIRQVVNRTNMSVLEQYALLSTSRYENERVFDIQSQAALDWLLNSSPKTATGTSFNFARFISQFVRKAGILKQCYPRHLVVCQSSGGTSASIGSRTIPQESILLAGKTRSTVLEFNKHGIHKIRKIPNSSQASRLNKNAFQATNYVTGEASKAIPQAKSVKTQFGLERHEQPVTGMPLDASLKPTPASIEKHLDIVFSWLIEFQNSNVVSWVQKEPATIENELSIDRIGLSNPLTVDRSVKIPQVIVHGDLFGSNIYLQDDTVVYVIDWECAEVGENPIIDPGLFLLQIAELIGEDFRRGFNQIFIKDNQYKTRVYPLIREYCDAIGISPYAFSIYLPISYIKHAKRHLQYGKRLDTDFAERINLVYHYQAALHNQILTTD